MIISDLLISKGSTGPRIEPRLPLSVYLI